MKHYFSLLIICLMVLISSCKKTDTIKLSTKSLDFTSSSEVKEVLSYGDGFYLETIVIDSKLVASRSSTNEGYLQLSADWIRVVSPERRSGDLVHRILVSVEANNTDSDRECKILLRGTDNKLIPLKVKQNKIQLDNNK